ncbi:MAG: MBL fold metallo-hydrolase [Treponema sp.]|nr:MBL fold metallo-hydrolase [Treponema sp.]
MEKKLNIKELRKDLFLLDEAGESTGYLLVGEKKACLIDTMMGYNNLKKVVEELTDKPVIVVNTHCHPDHIFGNVYFEKVYINPKDKDEALFFLADKEAKGQKFPPFVDINHGDIIDLGGRTLKIYELSGHTKGGILLLCPEERILFTGDSINHHLWMQLPNCITIKEFAENLEKLLFLENEADIILHGHGKDYDDISLLSSVLTGAKEIIAGENQKDGPYKYFGGDAFYHPFEVPEGKHFQQADSGICYVKEKIK